MRPRRLSFCLIVSATIIVSVHFLAYRNIRLGHFLQSTLDRIQPTSPFILQYDIDTTINNSFDESIKEHIPIEGSSEGDNLKEVGNKTLLHDDENGDAQVGNETLLIDENVNRTNKTLDPREDTHEEQHSQVEPDLVTTSSLNHIPIIPKPISIIPAYGYFPWNAQTMNIFYDTTPSNHSSLNSSLPFITKHLAEQWHVVSDPIASPPNHTHYIYFKYLHNVTLLQDHNITSDILGSEGYVLFITNTSIQILAHTDEAFFRSIQTLIQLTPPVLSTNPFKIPCGSILDYPTYPYRGIMIDVARHFFAVETLQRMIDILSLYKINHLHLHLTDDQGWRLEIPQWSNLTLVGAQTQVGGGTGGYFSQDQYTQIVSFAQKRFITIVPEFDLPGHSNAVLNSYPVLNCKGKDPPEPFTGTFGGFSSLCLENNLTQIFVQNVLESLIQITPGPLIHVGADEVFSIAKQDYCSFLQHAATVIESMGKRMIGWDDLGDCDFDSNFVVQWWRNWADGEKKVQTAVDRGHLVIMSPAKMTYMDMKYNSETPLGQTSVGYVDVDKAYNWNPETVLPGVDKKHILGVEAPCWTEFIYTQEDLDFMVFPRAIALAEIGWIDSPQRDWTDFRKRLLGHYERLTSLDVNFYKSPVVNG